jgi:hypothetical protein
VSLIQPHKFATKDWTEAAPRRPQVRDQQLISALGEQPAVRICPLADSPRVVRGLRLPQCLLSRFEVFVLAESESAIDTSDAEVYESGYHVFYQ